MDDFFKWTSSFASILSIGTFLYAFFIKRTLEEFQKKVLFNTRINQLVKELITANSSLLKTQSDITNQKRQLKTAYWEIDGVLKDINSKLPNELQKDITLIKKEFYIGKKLNFLPA